MSPGNHLKPENIVLRYAHILQGITIKNNVEFILRNWSILQESAGIVGFLESLFFRNEYLCLIILITVVFCPLMKSYPWKLWRKCPKQIIIYFSNYKKIRSLITWRMVYEQFTLWNVRIYEIGKNVLRIVILILNLIVKSSWPQIK